MSTIFEQNFNGLDNSIKAANSTDSTAPAYTGDNGVIKADFYNTGNKVVFSTQDGYTFSWTPQNMKYVDSFGMEDTVYSVQDVQIEVKANYARYNRPYESVDDWFIFENDQLKHQILVQGFQRDPLPFLTTPIDFVFGGQVDYDASLSIWIDGVPGAVTGAFETTGSIYFKNDTGQTVYSLPPVVAYDSKIPERANTTGKYRVTQNNAGSLAFDIVVDNGWFSDESRVYPILIDPTVVSSSTATPMVGGMSSSQIGRVDGTNTLYALVNNRAQGSYWGYNLYQSNDSGNTWSILAAVADADNSTTASMTMGTLLVLKTGEVYIYASSGAGNDTVYYYPGTGTTISSFKLSGGGSGGMSAGCTDSNGNVWFYNTQSVSPYTIYLIMVPKGNVSGAVRVSTTNSTYHYLWGMYFDSTLNAFLVAAGSSTSAVVCKLVPNSVTSPTTLTMSTVVSVTTSANAMAAACKLPNGDILFAYYTTTAVLTVAEYTPSGVLVNTKTQTNMPTSANGTATNSYLAAVSDGTNYYIFGLLNTANNSGYITYSKNGGAWSTVSSGTVSHGSMRLSNEFALTSMSNLDFVYATSTTSPYAIQFGSVTLNQPPNAPTNLLPTGGSTTTVTPTLSGTFSDPDAGNTMSALQVQVYRSSDNTLMWDSTKTPMTTTTNNQNWSIAVPGSANLQYGVQYYWKATTWDNSSAQGAWSTNQVFLTEQAPTVTITSPTAAQVVTTSSVTAQLSYSQAANAPEASYQFQLLDMNNNVLQDSGVVTSNANNMWTFNGLQNNTAYQIVGYATTKNGTQGTSAKVSFSTSFTAPYADTITATGNPATASATINWTNPAYKTSATATTRTGTGNGTMSQPTTTDGTTAPHSWRVVCTNATVPASFNVLVDGSSVGTARAGTAFSYNGVTFTITAGTTAFAVNDEFDFSTIAYQIAYNRLYKQVAGAWVLYQDNLLGTSFTDYLICSGVATTYGVSAMGTNGVESAISSVTITVTYVGDWLYDTSTGKQFQFLYNRQPYEMGTLEERKEFNTFGLKAMVRRGPQNAKKGTLAALMVYVPQSPISQIQAIEASIANHPVYYLKTAVGEIFKVDVYNPRRSMPQEYLNTQAIQFSVDWTEVA